MHRPLSGYTWFHPKNKSANLTKQNKQGYTRIHYNIYMHEITRIRCIYIYIILRLIKHVSYKRENEIRAYQPFDACDVVQSSFGLLKVIMMNHARSQHAKAVALNAWTTIWARQYSVTLFSWQMESNPYPIGWVDVLPMMVQEGSGI